MLSDPGTGSPRAILDGGPITAERTAAVSGVAIARFGPIAAATAGRPITPRASRSSAPACRAAATSRSSGNVLPGARVTIVDRHPERAAALAEVARGTAGDRVGDVLDRRAEPAGEADVVITAASFADPARRQVMDPTWLAADALVVAVDYATMVSAAVAREAALFLVDDARPVPGQSRCRPIRRLSRSRSHARRGDPRWHAAARHRDGSS